MGSCLQTSLGSASTALIDKKASLIVQGYFRLHINPSNPTPLDILNLCIDFFKYNIFDEFKDGDSVMIQHYGGQAGLENFIKRLRDTTNPFGTMGDKENIWTIRIFKNNSSAYYVSFRSPENVERQLVIETCFQFMAHPVYSRNGIKLETRTTLGQYIRVDRGVKLAVTQDEDEADQNEEQCTFTIWPAFKKVTSRMMNVSIKELTVVIKSASDGGRGNYLRVNPRNLDMIDVEGDKGVHSRWLFKDGTFRSIVSGKYLNVVEIDGGYMVNASAIGEYPSTYFSVNDGKQQGYLNLSVSKGNITLEWNVVKGLYIQFEMSGDVSIGKYGVFAELEVFTQAK